MWNFLKSFLAKPVPPEERLWKLVTHGLAGDAKLLASGLDAANRPPAGKWATTLIECEIAALRAWAGCAALSGGEQTNGEALIRSFETRFGDWLGQQRQQQLSAYSTFSQTTLPDTLASLIKGWRRYDSFIQSAGKISPETLSDLIALFWGRCVEGYTGQKIDTFLSQGEARIDTFIPRYVSFQIQLASGTPPPEAIVNADGGSGLPAMPNPPPPPLPKYKYTPGEVWTFKGAEAEPNATLTILHVEPGDQHGPIVHIAISGIILPNSTTTIRHMPFAEAAIDRSVITRMRDRGPVPDFRAGYLQWQQERGGFFTVSVADGIDCIRQSLAIQL